ncbi:hypothetical protein QTP86_023275, partial [Hemibagrus guttatus]
AIRGRACQSRVCFKSSYIDTLLLRARCSGLDRKSESWAGDNVNALPSELKLKKNPSDGCERWSGGVGSAGEPRLELQGRCHGAHRAGGEEEGGEYRTHSQIIIIIILVVAVVASRDGSRSQLCPGSRPHALQEMSLRRRQGEMCLVAPRRPGKKQGDLLKKEKIERRAREKKSKTRERKESGQRASSSILESTLSLGSVHGFTPSLHLYVALLQGFPVSSHFFPPI